ncbi:MAG: DivIVA domain-containing protein [Clostridia bacterium]|nr:DivIVA domain-containing protein [Clostridia bacterium]
MAETYFKKKFKGYDPEAVDSFIVSLSDTYESNVKNYEAQLRESQAENGRLRDEIAELRELIEETARAHEAELAKKQEEYEALYAEIGEKMVVADNRAAEIIRNAEKEAEFITIQAKEDVERDAKNIRARAEDDAKALIDETRRKCDDISAAAEEFRIKQEEMNRSVMETERRFGDALSKLREGIGNGN